ASAAARSWYTPGFTAEGNGRVMVRLFASSSRWNERLSGGIAVHPDGGVSTTCAAAGPRVRLVTVTVKCRGPAAVPSTGQTTRSGEVSRPGGRTVHRPDDEIGCDGHVEGPGDEDRPAHLANTLVAVAVHHLTRE